MKTSGASVSIDIPLQGDPNGNPLEETVEEETVKPEPDTSAKAIPNDILELKKWIWDLRFSFLLSVPLVKITEAMNDEISLRRWLNAHQGSVYEAAIAILSNLIWRDRNQVEKILEGSYLEKHSTNHPIHFGSVDNAGRPVIYIPLHLWRTQKIQELERSGEWLKYVISFFEQAMKECSEAKLPPGVPLQFSLIVNTEGLSAFKLMKQKALWRFSLFSKILTIHYPGTMLRCVVINVASPRDLQAFHYALTGRFMWIDCDINSPLQIYLKTEYFKWITLLRSRIQPDQLPVECGGWKQTSEDVVDTKSLPLALF